ncbi:hypothetical protein MIR68_005753 [Amoeboaphelidium protococcarum]|nr:hypothetical protein MIR68_005753 [Amoeboaphelidium protococcarum]KAI3645927.1 hypothetical protein MP228_008855 [Amoeboaphelidium protococcarum]
MISVLLFAIACSASVIQLTREIKPLEVDYTCTGSNVPLYFGYPYMNWTFDRNLMKVDSLKVFAEPLKASRFIVQDFQFDEVNPIRLTVAVNGLLSEDIVPDTAPVRLRNGDVKQSNLVYDFEYDSNMTRSLANDFVPHEQMEGSTTSTQGWGISVGGACRDYGGCPVEKGYKTLVHHQDAGEGNFIKFHDGAEMWLYYVTSVNKIYWPKDGHRNISTEKIVSCCGFKLSKESLQF